MLEGWKNSIKINEIFLIGRFQRKKIPSTTLFFSIRVVKTENIFTHVSSFRYYFSTHIQQFLTILTCSYCQFLTILCFWCPFVVRQLCNVPTLLRSKRSMIVPAILKLTFNRTGTNIPLATVITNFSALNHAFFAAHPFERAITFHPVVRWYISFAVFFFGLFIFRFIAFCLFTILFTLPIHL